MESESLYIRVLSVGIILNAASSSEESIGETLWPKIIQVLSNTLELDQRKMVNDFTSEVPLLLQASIKSKKSSKNRKATDDGEDNPDKMEEEPMEQQQSKQPVVGRPEVKIAELRAKIGEVVQAQQTALEILTNVCCSTEEKWEDEDDIDEEDMEDIDDDTMAEGEESNCTSLLSTLPPFLADSLQNADMFKKVLGKANLPAENVCQILREDCK